MNNHLDNRLIVKELKQILAESPGDNMADVVLFGSRLKGTAHQDSDVLIVLKSDYDWKKKKEISDLCYEIDLKYDVFLDTQIFH